MITQPAPLDADPRPPELCVGYPIYWFDANLRVYAERKPGEGYAHGGPIWRKHWRLVRITGESPRLWIVNHGAAKFSKTIRAGELLPNGLVWDAAELDLKAWAHDNRYPIANAVQRLDADSLTRIARLIGYEPLPPS